MTLNPLYNSAGNSRNGKRTSGRTSRLHNLARPQHLHRLRHHHALNSDVQGPDQLTDPALVD